MTFVFLLLKLMAALTVAFAIFTLIFIMSVMITIIMFVLKDHLSVVIGFITCISYPVRSLQFWRPYYAILQVAFYSNHLGCNIAGAGC